MAMTIRPPQSQDDLVRCSLVCYQVSVLNAKALLTSHIEFFMLPLEKLYDKPPFLKGCLIEPDLIFRLTDGPP